MSWNLFVFETRSFAVCQYLDAAQATREFDANIKFSQSREGRHVIGCVLYGPEGHVNSWQRPMSRRSKTPTGLSSDWPEPRPFCHVVKGAPLEPGYVASDDEIEAIYRHPDGVIQFDGVLSRSEALELARRRMIEVDETIREHNPPPPPRRRVPPLVMAVAVSIIVSGALALAYMALMAWGAE